MYLLHIPGSSDGKELACNAGDPGSIPGREDPLKKGIRGVHGVTESHVTERLMKLLNKGKTYIY